MICRRLKEARERLGLDQAEAARRVGVAKHVLANVEKFRSPLRFDLALRFCRELFVNEEWLACGSVDFLDDALQSSTKNSIIIERWEPIFFRTPLDLLSHQVCTSIPPRTLFSDAFARSLAPVARELSKGHWFAPRIVLSSYDRRSFRREYLATLIERWVQMIGFRAEERGVPPEYSVHCEWELVDALIKAAMLISYRSFGVPTPFQSGPEYNFLRIIMGDSDTPIGCLNTTVEFKKDGRVLERPIKRTSLAKPHKTKAPRRSKK